MSYCETHEEGHSVEWNERAVALFERRLHQFQNRKCSHATDQAPSNPQDAENQAGSSMNPSSEHVMEIPELLENILSHTDLQSQLQAMHVSKLWRFTAELVIRSQYCSEPTLKPVEYASPQDENGAVLPWLKVSEKDFAEFEEMVRQLGPEDEDTGIFFPARLTQNPQLSARSKDRIKEFHTNQIPCHDISLPQPQWLDFTQFRFLPCFKEIFQSGMVVNRGVCEISLRPDACSEHLIHSPNLNQTALDKLLGDVFFTEPPCSTLGVYNRSCPLTEYRRATDYYANGNFSLLTRIHNKEGITLRQLLYTLRENVQTVIDDWMHLVKAVQEDLKKREWDSYLYDEPEDYDKATWIIGATPRFVLMLDQEGINVDYKGHYTRAKFLDSVAEGRDYKKEWLNLPYASEYVDCAVD